jgi:hypothetical protein
MLRPGVGAAAFAESGFHGFGGAWVWVAMAVLLEVVAWRFVFVAPDDHDAKL